MMRTRHVIGPEIFSLTQSDSVADGLYKRMYTSLNIFVFICKSDWQARL